MSDQINRAFIQQYTNNVQHLVQQRGSRLRESVTVGTHQGKGAKAVEQVGQVAATKRTGRHTDTPLIFTPHDARWVFPQDYEWADLIDDQDRLRTLIDPTSPYAMNAAYALGRGMDDEVISSLFGLAKTGEDGTTNTAFPASQQVASGSVGMTVEKLRLGMEILMANEVDIDNDPIFCVITAKQHRNLLTETQAISLDYNETPRLEQGRIRSFMGINFIHTERLLLNGSSERRCPLYARSGMWLGVWKDVASRIGERADKSYSTQVYACMTVGATRVEEKKVVEIPCV